MTAPVFLAEIDDLAAVQPGGRVRLSGPEGRHAATVRRLRAGEPIDLVDGLGTRASGVVERVAGPSDIDVAVARVERSPVPPVRLTVVQALLKGDRMESAVEMLTEIGADAVVPWSAERCVAAWRPERAGRAGQRLRATAVAAGKQSCRARFPVIAALADSQAVAGLLAAADLGIVLHEQADGRLADVRLPQSGHIVVVVGPEGGITGQELVLFAASGATTVRMGPSVLRAATAAVAAGAVVLSKSGRWA